MQCLATHTVSGAATRDILVGRNDGTVEVYAQGGGGDPPRLVFRTRLSAAITGITGGRVRSADHDEVLVSTYAGQIVGFTTEVVADVAGSGRADGATRQRELERLHGELAALEQAVAAERAVADIRAAREAAAAAEQRAAVEAIARRPVPVHVVFPQQADVAVTDSVRWRLR